MIQSMTAFSRVQCAYNTMILTWELRSLNHRYLDCSFRLPESLRYLEDKLRLGLRGKVHRGRLDFQLKLDDSAIQSVVMVNESLLQNLMQESQRLSVQYGLPDDMTLSRVLAWPGVMTSKSSDNADLALSVEQLFHQGVDELLLGRRTEGQLLSEQIQARLPKIRAEIAAAQAHTTSMLTNARQKLMKRLDALQMQVADTRLEQELALTLTRLDVSEELDRLTAHVDEVEKTLLSGEPCGKRLDFLMQELNREANTLSSKSDTITLSQHAVQLKVLIEQIREQIQNVE